MKRPSPNWAKTGTVHGYAEWLRKESDAICVLVVRPNDAVFVVDRSCQPREAQNLVEERVGDLAIAVDQVRRGLKKDGRLELGPCPE